MAILNYANYPIWISTNKTTWYALPAAAKLKASWETLDASTTGRDNNTGKMFRDKVADKAKWEIDIPFGMTNSSVKTANKVLTGVPALLSLVKDNSFYIMAPDTLTGTCTVKNVYCSKCEPEIHKILTWTAATTNSPATPATWDYNAFSIHIIEI